MKAKRNISFLLCLSWTKQEREISYRLTLSCRISNVSVSSLAFSIPYPLFPFPTLFAKNECEILKASPRYEPTNACITVGLAYSNFSAITEKFA